MYQIYNYLFGWDYIAWTNSTASGVARVRVAKDGTVFYWRYKNTNVLDKLTDPEQVVWLTCPPNKYLTD